MCEVQSAVLSSILTPEVTMQQASADLPAGFLTLTDQQFRATVFQEPIELYYEICPAPICTGQWASVYKCLELSSGGYFAAKFCSKTRMGVDSSREIMHEVAAMYHARDCPRVVRLHQVFETQHQLVLVMELGSGGDLQGVLDNDQVPYEPDVVRFITNLLEGLAFLHDRNIAHLDIKPQNLVMTGTFPDCDIKLCDLEIARIISSGQEIREMLGTPDYVSPEILRFEPVMLSADIWSVGVLAYVLLTGFTPFGGDTDSETFRNIAMAELEFPDELFEDVSASAKDFIRRCLLKDPRSRPTSHQLLQHDWLQQLRTPAPPQVIISPSGSLDDCHEPSQDSHGANKLRRSISKSREVLSVKVSRGNLKKNISKSRERLCEMTWTVPMRPDQFPACLRSNASEMPDNRPPWKGAGVQKTCPGSAKAERVNTFKLRDEYQSQVAAGLAGSGQSLEGGPQTAPSPFVRHGSLRGRRKTSTPNGSSTDIRSSLRRNRNTESAMNRRNSCQEDSRTLLDAGKKKEGPKRTSSASDAILHFEKGSSLTQGTLLSVEEDKPNKEDVETFSDDDDVFTRLYKDCRKDVEPKSRLMSNKYIGNNDDEKENIISAKTSTLSGDKSRVDTIPSPACPRRQYSPTSRTHKTSLEQTDQLPNQTSSGRSDSTPDDTELGQLDTPHMDSSNSSDLLKQHEPCRPVNDASSSTNPVKQEIIKPATSHTSGSTSSATSSGIRQTSPRRHVSPRRRPTPSDTHHQSKPERRKTVDMSQPAPSVTPERRKTVDMSQPAPSVTPSLRHQTSLDRPELQLGSSTASGVCCDQAMGGEAVRLAAILDEDVVWERTQALGSPTVRGRPSVQTLRSLAMRKPRDAAERKTHEPALERTAPFRSSLRSTSRQRAAQLATSRPYPGEDGRRPPPSATDEAGRGLRKSSTDEDMRRLFAMEQTGRRGNEAHRQLRKSSTEEDVRRLSASAPDDDGRRRFKSSSDWVGRGLRKSSTEEDVRQLAYTGGRDDRRSAVASRRKAVPFLRSTSLTSDPGSEQSDASGELYNVTAWQERAEPAGSTELRPVTTCRLVRRPRARTTQPAPAPTSPRLASTCTVTSYGSLSHDNRPAGSVFSNTVSHAVKRFQALADEAKQHATPAAVLRSPCSPRKGPSPAAQSPCVTPKSPSPAMRARSPRGKPVCEWVSRPNAGQ